MSQIAYIKRLYKPTTNYPPGHKFKYHTSSGVKNCEVYSKEMDEQKNSSTHYWAKIEGLNCLYGFQEHQMIEE